MHSHSSAHHPVPGAEAFPGGSGALVIEIFLSPRRKRRSAAMPRSGVCFSLFRSSFAQVGAAQDLVA